LIYKKKICRHQKEVEANSYWEIGEFWGTHDLTAYWDKTRPAHFEVDIQSEVTYYALDRELSDGIAKLSAQRGVSPQTLLNLWVQEKLQNNGGKKDRPKRVPRARGRHAQRAKLQSI
jgi:hypothetical protein